MVPGLPQVLGDLQELGVELLAVSGDPRERAKSFVRPCRLPPSFRFRVFTPNVLHVTARRSGKSPMHATVISDGI